MAFKKRRRRRLPLSRKKILLTIFIFFMLLLGASALYAKAVVWKKIVVVSPLANPFFKPPSDVQMSEIEKGLSQKQLGATSIVRDEGGYTVKLNNDTTVLFSSDKSIEEQISSLQLIISRLTIEGKHVTRIDFRFDKPVIAVQ